jgi:hypothetical protein
MNPLLFLGQAVTEHAAWLADPTPAPGGDVTSVKVAFNSAGVMKFLFGTAGPIALALLGIFILFRSRRGDWSATMNAGGVALVGCLFLGGAGVLVLLGPWLADQIVTKVG